MENVPNIVQNITNFKSKYKEIVHELIKIRNEAGFTQQFLAEWLEVDRRKIIVGMVKLKMMLMNIHTNLTYSVVIVVRSFRSAVRSISHNGRGYKQLSVACAMERMLIACVSGVGWVVRWLVVINRNQF